MFLISPVGQCHITLMWAVSVVHTVELNGI